MMLREKKKSKCLAYKVCKIPLLTHQVSFSIGRDIKRNRIHSTWFKRRGYEITSERSTGRVEETNKGWLDVEK